MTAELQASRLAAWLDSRGEDGRLGTPPVGLDADVIEAVYALRPEFAPSSSLTIEDILKSVEEAPALGSWLAGADAAQESLSDDVREAIFALRPDRAPSPRVSIDDILERVEAGPFAKASAGGEVIPFPAPASPPEDVDEEPTEEPAVIRARKPAWRRWALFGGSLATGGALAAAAALVLVLGTMENATLSVDNELAAPKSVSSAKRHSVSPAEMPRTASEATGEGESIASAEPEWRPAFPRVATSASPPPMKPVSAQSTSSVQPAAIPEIENDAVVDAFDEPSSITDATDVPEVTSVPADFGPPPQDFLEKSEPSVQFGRDAPMEAEPVAEYAPRGNIRDTNKKEQVVEADADDVGQAQSRSRATESVPPTASEPAPASGGATLALAAESEESAGYASPLPSAPGSSALDPSLRSRLASLEAQANALVAKGRLADAARVLTGAIVPPATVGQYYAARVSGYYLQADQVQSALDAAELGLSLGKTASPDLLRAYATALDAANRPVDAEAIQPPRR